ncbi:low molecular weight protein-tyrosine-phosphatase [Acinetobacter boissieri]|uniref:protein-tyrosine-phosphatase n=1 Tax=Acinetobacter boissieri TaxID=1219383 RepID=A0A1G6GZ20_9GAMM|nr:low molecular weight protein-tyrosine-phosphatase [Acinetobacter boissieri]SDB87148.1 protein-tyrosine phosphatase [Acinetobacter boissieri]
MKPYRVLCVCLGNICRSPTAEEVLRCILKQHHLNVLVDSAGTSNYHPNAAPDPRSQAHAKRRGYDLSTLKARQIQLKDWYDFDLILAMDLENLKELKKLRQQAVLQVKDSSKIATLALMTESDAHQTNQPIEDPYYGGELGFDQVLDQCESASQAWATYFKKQHIG